MPVLNIEQINNNIKKYGTATTMMERKTELYTKKIHNPTAKGTRIKTISMNKGIFAAM